MTRDEIIRMAQEANVSIRGYYDETGATPQELARFARIVAAAEREACAKIVDAAQPFGRIAWTAAAISARGDT